MAAVDLATHPGHLARRLQQAHHLLWTTMVSEKITSPQYAVLNALVAEPGLDQRTVGERVGLDRSTIADVVARLMRRGLLGKDRDPLDGRRFLLRPTGDGERVHRALTVRAARMNHVFLAPLDAAEQALFLDLARRVADAAERLRHPDGPGGTDGTAGTDGDAGGPGAGDPADGRVGGDAPSASGGGRGGPAKAAADHGASAYTTQT
ncbi:hypothetical protein SUDANB70_00731 [Streptomyces sp. enrichment culture]